MGKKNNRLSNFLFSNFLKSSKKSSSNEVIESTLITLVADNKYDSIYQVQERLNNSSEDYLLSKQLRLKIVNETFYRDHQEFICIDCSIECICTDNRKVKFHEIVTIIDQ